jgi:toxin ParE1/3/4
VRVVTWADAAKRDLANIDDWYEQRDPDYADRVGDLAIAAARIITEFPNAGAALDGTKVRKWNIARTDYRLIYLITDTQVEIVRVRHARENWRDEA